MIIGKTITKVGVDAGMIIVADASKIQKGDVDERKSGHIKKVPNGMYYAEVTVHDTWRGTVKSRGILTITTGEMVVTDPCYICKDDFWETFLKRVYNDWGVNANKFKGMKNKKYLSNEGIIIADNMGGDGKYEVTVKLELLYE